MKQLSKYSSSLRSLVSYKCMVVMQHSEKQNGEQKNQAALNKQRITQHFRLHHEDILKVY